MANVGICCIDKHGMASVPGRGCCCLWKWCFPKLMTPGGIGGEMGILHSHCREGHKDFPPYTEGAPGWNTGWVEVNTSEQANLAVWGELMRSFLHCNRVINVQWVLTHQRHLCVWMHLSAEQSLSQENSTGEFFRRGTSAQVSLSQLRLLQLFQSSLGLSF